MIPITFSEWHYQERAKVLTGLLLPPSRSMRSAMCQKFGEVLSGKPMLPLNRASSGLVLALQTFHLMYPDRHEVIVPAYICPIVIAAIQAAGLRAVSTDVCLDLNLNVLALERTLSSSTLAVVVAHMYGRPAPIQEVESLCRSRGIFVIDDAAQAFGVALDGKPLGTLGHVGMVSFGQSKPIAVGDQNAGGLLVINDPELEPALRASWELLPEVRNYRADVLRFLWEYKWRRWTETANYLGQKLVTKRRQVQKRTLNVSKMTHLSASLGMSQLGTLRDRILGRKRVADLYSTMLANYPDIEFPQYRLGRYLARIMLALPEQASRIAIRAKLHDMGVRTRLGYPIYCDHVKISIVTALELCPRLIEVPSRSQMSETEIDCVLTSLDKAIKSCENFARRD